jgi:transcription termination factor Rho
MSAAPELERSVLEQKERGELHVIAESLGLKPGTRTKKSDLIDQILHATGVVMSQGEPSNGASHANGTNGAERRYEGRGPGDDAIDAEPPAAIDAPEDPSPAEPEAAGEPTAGAAMPPDPESADAEARRQPEPAERPSGAGPSGGGPSGGGPSGAGSERKGRDWAGNGTPRGNGSGDGEGGRRRRRRGRDRQGSDRDVRDVAAERTAPIPPEPSFAGDPIPVAGFLDLREEGFGFVRAHGFTTSSDDVYVASIQAKRFGLRKGDYVEGVSRPAGAGEKFPALLRIETVSGMTVDEARQRRRFEDLTPLFPDHKLRMEAADDPSNVTARIVDLMCPIGKGQRGLIVSPPKAGKTTVIKQIAKSIEANNPEVHLIVLLVDERPEEVTDMRRSVNGEVVASTFDRPSDEHTHVAELALERAKRLVEVGRDVMIILDGITRLTRAYNLSAPASGRLTSGGIDQAAIYPPKKFFGAARNAEEGGSLTILATALVETGSKADDVIFEELKGTGNMELRLDRRLAERRLYPAIDVNASSTRHEELLLDRVQLQLVWRLRRVLNGLSEDGTSYKALELLIEKIRTTRTNDEFLAEIAKTQMPV